VIALGVGLVIGQSGLLRSKGMHGMHRMPNGEMMSNNMSAMMHDMNASLRGKTGDDFDKTFLEEMIVHHEGAVSMAQEVLNVSERKELRDLASEIITAQEKEISMMQNWLSEWF